MSNIIILFFVKSVVPMSFIGILTGIAFSYYRDNFDGKTNFIVKNYWFSFVVAVFFFLIMTITGETFNKFIADIIKESKSFDIGNINAMDIIAKGMFSPPQMFTICGLLVGFYQMYLDTIRVNQNREIIKIHNRKKEKIDDWTKIPLDFVKNLFIIGKNGSGKTVAISHFIIPHIESGEFCVIMDGKGDVGNFSLYDIVKKLCNKYNRKLYIINQTLPQETDSYNPFIGCNETQIKDMLLNMSEWSEEHYKNKVGEYYQALAQLLLKIEIPISFNSIAKYGSPSTFSSLLNMYRKFLEDDDINYYKDVIFRCGEDVEGSVSRFITISRGVGKKIFEDKNAFNLQKAYEENAVVLVILNKLEYTDFARSLGMLVLNDVKNVLGKASSNKDEEHKKFLCVYDELSVYFCEMVIDIVNKARSLGGTNILSTQSISDMDLIDENLRRTTINNTHGFYILKQADDKSAEAISSAIGTKKSTEITSKIDSFGKTGDGTTKIVDEFRIHPNDLKDLPLGVGYWVDTTTDRLEVLRTRFPYLEL